MAKETEQVINESMTDEAIRIEFQRMWDALKATEDRNILRKESADRAIELASETLSLRLEGMNQFRDQIQKERNEYLRRDLYDRGYNGLEERVKSLEIARGSYSGSYIAAGVVAIIVGQIIGFVLLYLRH